MNNAMKKISIVLMLGILIITIPFMLTSCDEEETNTPYTITPESFYGEYLCPVSKYFHVTITSNTEGGAAYNVVGVKGNIMVHQKEIPLYEGQFYPKYEYYEKELDQNVAKELENYLDYMGDHIEIRHDSIYFSDSRQAMKFDWFEPDIDDGPYCYFEGEKLSGICRYSTWYKYGYQISAKYDRDVQQVQVGLGSRTVIDTNGQEWQISIQREYMRFYNRGI